MAALTDTWENNVLDWLRGEGAAPTRPTGPLKLALITTATPPTDSVAGSEVSGGSYARQNCNIGAAAGGALTNSSEIRFTGMPAATIGHVELWDSAGSPTRIWHGAITGGNRTVNSGDDVVIPAGDLDITLA